MAKWGEKDNMGWTKVAGESHANGLTKHEQIIRYIKALEIRTKVSVRQIAKELAVSEGTAYRAIKEAEGQGLVCSIPKVGTIRIEQKEERQIEQLTLQEIAKIVEGEFLTGQDLAGTAPLSFVIGSYKPATLRQFLGRGSLLMVGDRLELQALAVEMGAHLLITAVFDVSEEIIREAERKGVAVISSPYDSFEAVSMLNRAADHCFTDKALLQVSDIMVRDVRSLPMEATVADWHRLAAESHFSRFPVVDQNGAVVGIVTAVDVAGKDPQASILSVMTKNVLMVEPRMLVSHLSRLLVWEGFELVPIVERRKLVGVVSRQDIIKAFQQTQKQPHVGETIDNLVMSGFKLEDLPEKQRLKEAETLKATRAFRTMLSKGAEGTESGESADGIMLSGEITRFMINEDGTASPGILTTIVSTAAYIAARKQYRLDTVVDNLSLQHLQPLAVGDVIEVRARIIHLGKKFCLADVSIFGAKDQLLRAKAVVSARIVKR